ncbi:MAG: TonB-dependent receptor [Deltaproteobacteria bacterium]|nr:TonB-dependent receptor [Deltaproteobacteria bacterium]
MRRTSSRVVGVATALLGAALLAATPLGATQGPPVPAGVQDGDLVELDGVVYQRKGDRLYTLDDPVFDDPVAPDETARGAITVTGSPLDARRRDKVLRAEAVDGAALSETGARTLADVLAEQGGLQVNSSRGLGAEVTMDGLDGRHVLILVDGRPVVGKVDSRVDVSRLPVSASSIERIEIVRGPMSALYGSDGIAGVVNIITKRPTARGRVELELGGQAIPHVGDVVSWTTAGLHTGGGAGPLALRLDVTGTAMPGFDRGGRATGKDVADGRSDLPDRRNAAANLDVVAVVQDDWSLRTTLTSTVAQSSASIAAAAPFRDATDTGETAAAVALTGVVAAAGLPRPVGLTADLRVDRYTHRFFKLPAGDAAAPPPFCDTAFAPACPAPPQTKTNAALDQARLELRSVFVFVDDPSSRTAWGRELSLSTGAVLARERAQRRDGEGTDTLPGGGERTTASVYAEALWRPLPALSLSPGARVDAFVVDGASDEGALALGPKLAARLDLPAGLALRASAGQGFRLPSFEERFLRFDHSELGYVVDGNAALRPERSTGARLEVVFAPDAAVAADNGVALPVPVDAGVELAGNALNDLITEAPAGTTDAGIPRFTYANAARAWTATLTTRAAVGPVDLNAVALRLEATWQYLLNAVDASACPADDPWLCSADAGARSLPLRPTHAVDLTAKATLPTTATTFFFRADLLGERPLVGDVAPPSAVLALGVRQPFPIGDDDGAELMVGVENLLDHTDPVFGPKPGRHVSVNLRVW